MSAATQKKEMDGRTGWLDLYDALPFRESRQSTTIRREDFFTLFGPFISKNSTSPSLIRRSPAGAS